MPFVNNRESGGYAIIDYIITDKVANDFVDVYESQTYPAFKKYEYILFKLKKYQRNIAQLITHTPTKLPITKAFKYIDIKPLIPNRLPIYIVAPPVPTLSSFIVIFYKRLL